MKNTSFAAVCALFVAMIAAFAFTPKTAPAEIVDGVEYYQSSGAVVKAFTKDTITNAANDTLNLNFILASPYQYAAQVRMTNISGTRNVKFYLQQTAATGSNRWMTVDSAITSGSTINDYLMRGANTWGNKYRIIVDGTGTQSTAYQVDAYFKKTN